MRAIDITGQRFGRLVALGRVEGAKPGVTWLCRCDCGNEKPVLGISLRCGNTSSCGCLTRERASEVNSIDLTEQRFGRLVVVARVKERIGKGTKTRWQCICDCGRPKKVIGTHLRRGKINSCGCLRVEAAKAADRAIDRTGRRYGRLLVVSRAPNEGRVAMWNCVCDCGKPAVVAAHNLQSNQVSCGCARGRTPVRRSEVRAAASGSRIRRYHTNPRFRLESLVRSAVHQSLRKRGGKKKGRLWDLLGYTAADLENRLRKQLPKGYTWDDFMTGRLHIDHRIPLAAFNYTRDTDHDFKRAWALSNLQLLPGGENMSKGDRLEKPFQPSLAF